MNTNAVQGPAAAPASPGAPDAPVFYYELGSPECYLVAERVSAVLPVSPEWVPVLGGFQTDNRDLDRGRIEALAAARGLQPVRWPARWPPDTELAVRAATYAKGIGRVTAFSLAAFRQAFAAGRDLGSPDTLVIAAAACEIRPAALLNGIELRSVAAALERATAQAAAAGVRSLPAIGVGKVVFEGEAGPDNAARALGGAR
jgi:2-hydroxychromene-2-carboxylate isomerase